MTGENAEELASKRGGDKNKKKKRRLKPESPKPPESEPSLMSDITKTESEMEHKPEPEEGAEEPPEGEDLVEQRKKLVPLDRNKFGKYIVTYGKQYGIVPMSTSVYQRQPTRQRTTNVTEINER